MSEILNTRLGRLDRLQKMRARLIRVNGGLEAAKLDPRWDTLNLLISVITNRIATSLEPSNITEPLSAAEIIFLNFLLNNLQDL